MAATVGSINVNTTIQTAELDRGIEKVRGKLKGLQKSFADVGAKMSSIGKNMTVGITAPFAAFAAKGIAEARETAAAMAQVNAALTSMGPVAGKTAGQLEKAANAFEGKSLFEADQILSKVSANLLTFGNISGQAFDRAQQAALDLSTRMGTDLQSSALLVGKALNDPIKGMTALGRAGIQFTAAQKESIAAMVAGGNAAGAQAMILKELERQFGGAAAAAQNADPWNRLTDAFNSMAESVGTLLLPIIPPLADALAGVAKWFTELSPATQKWVAGLAAVAAATGPLLIVMGSIVGAVGKMAPLVTALSAAWGILKTVFLAARIAAIATLPALLPFLIPLAAIAAAVGAAYLAWKNWDKIKPIVQNMVAGVTGWLQKLASPFNWVIEKLSVVGRAFFQLYDKVVGHSYMPDMVTGIAAEMAKLDAVMVQPAKAAASKTALAFRELQGRVSNLLAELFPEQAQELLFKKQLADINAEALRANWSVGMLAETIERLKIARGLIKIETEDLPTISGEGPAPTPFGGTGSAVDFSALLEQIGPQLQRIGDLGGGAFAKIADSLVQSVIPAIQVMMDKTAEAGDKMKAMGNAVTSVFTKLFGRKWGGILGSIVNIGIAVGGALGKAKTPGAANGGLFKIGGAGGSDKNMLSLNGMPSLRVSAGEMLSVMPKNQYQNFMNPRDANQAAARPRVEIVPSPYFDVVVDGRIQRSVPPMVAHGMHAAAAGGHQATLQSQRRQIP